MDLPCQIFIRSGCCFPKFRLYIGHKDTHSVSVAIRHLSASEIKKGLSFMTQAYWFKMGIVDVTSDAHHEVLINRNSLIKNLAKVGIAKTAICRCMDTLDFSGLKLEVMQKPCLAQVSSPIFYSHGPLP